MKNFLLFITLVFGLSAGATIVSAVVPGGNWSDAGTWDGPVPGCYDTIVIPFGASVTVANNVDLEACGPITILLEGNLHFNMGQKLYLPCNSAIEVGPSGSITADAYVGSNNQIEICGDDVWTSSDGPIGGGTTLDIELVSFEAELIERKTHVTWSTKSETNSDYFTVYRSYDGSAWEELGTLDAAGNSTEQIDYSLIDKAPLLGLNYYRLSETDLNGYVEYFDPVVVNNRGVQLDNELLVFPNPSGGNQITVFLTDYAKDNVEIEIISLGGKQIISKKISVSDDGFAVVTLPNEPAPGMYSLRASGEIEKIVMQ